jgi:histidine triad (HIT) family protein
VTHPTDGSCIFCKIVAGQLPCFKLLEDDTTIAFMDINPIGPGHVIPSDVLADVARTAQKVAKAAFKVLKPSGVNLVQSNGPGAGQTVPHLHMHIISRQAGDRVQLGTESKPGDMKAIEAVFQELKAAL